MGLFSRTLCGVHLLEFNSMGLCPQEEDSLSSDQVLSSTSNRKAKQINHRNFLQRDQNFIVFNSRGQSQSIAFANCSPQSQAMSRDQP